MSLTIDDIQIQLRRRRPGQSHLTTSRDEADLVSILSGVEDGLTLGSPIALLVHNFDHRPGAYTSLQNIPRPSHADFTYQGKYGIRANSGGGRSSARETIGRVAAGAIAEKWLRERFSVTITAFVSSVGDIAMPEQEQAHFWTRDQVDQTPVRCPDLKTAARMIDRIEEVKADHDSIGGIITCHVLNVPIGWGEPVFDRLEAKLAQAMMSIPASKGFEIGSGFAGTAQRGSDHNDVFVADVVLRPATNRSGGVLGGISSGSALTFRTAFKAAATIGKAQVTSSWSGDLVVLEAAGRHDACIVPRAVPIVETMAALVLADAAMIQLGRESAASFYHPGR